MKKILPLFLSSAFIATLFSQVHIPIGTIDFESEFIYLRVDSTESLWHIASPQKIFFNSAQSPSHAILTDSIKSYPANSNSYFEIAFSEFNVDQFWAGVYLDFYYKVDTDSLLDGGYITYSVDGGLSWANIIDDAESCWDENPHTNNFKNINLYTSTDTLHNGETGFSGTTNEWTNVVFGWETGGVLSALCDTLLVRFNFTSDAIDNEKDGWMIDDIYMYSDFTSSTSNQDALAVQLYPNPAISMLNIDFQEELYDASLSILSSTGTVLKSYNIKQAHSFQLKDLDIAPDMYYIQLVTADGRHGIQSWIKSD